MAHCRGKVGREEGENVKRRREGTFDITIGSVLKWSIANRNFAESAC